MNSVEFGRSFNEKFMVPTDGLIPSQMMSKIPSIVRSNLREGPWLGVEKFCGDLFWETLRFAPRRLFLVSGLETHGRGDLVPAVWNKTTVLVRHLDDVPLLGT